MYIYNILLLYKLIITCCFYCNNSLRNPFANRNEERLNIYIYIE